MTHNMSRIRILSFLEKKYSKHVLMNKSCILIVMRFYFRF